MVKILFIDMNSFFASVEQQERAECRNKPILVAPLLTDSTCAISVSYEARAFGIKTGTSVRDAKTLCPEVIVIPADPRKYVVYHKKIIEVLDHYFSTVHVLSVDEMACVLGYRHQTKDTASLLALKIKAHIKEYLGSYLRSSIGIGPNIFLSKVASDIEKPDGLTVFDSSYWFTLFKLKLTDLPGIASRTEARLNNYNIYTVEDLWRARPHELRTAWGSVVGERWYYMLRGSLEVDYGMHTSDIKKSVGHSHVLAPNLRNKKGVEDVLLKLTSKALKRLRSYNQEASRLYLSITYRHTKDLSKKYKWRIDKKQNVATSDDLFWLPLVSGWSKEAPERQWFIPIKAAICFSELTSSSKHQIGLFHDRKKYIDLFHKIDKINETYGTKVEVASVFKNNQAPFRISFGKPS